MRAILLLLTLSLSINIYSQDIQDFVITNSGDTIYGHIDFEGIWYNRKKHLKTNNLFRNYPYNGYHGVIMKIERDSFLFFTADALSSCHQQQITYSPTKWFTRPQAIYRKFDLRKKARLGNNDILRYRYILGSPATPEIIDYPMKYNTPYTLYFTFIAGKHAHPYLAYILAKDEEAYLLGYPHNLAKLARIKNIPPDKWQKGGGKFIQKVLRLQFALNAQYQTTPTTVPGD